MLHLGIIGNLCADILGQDFMKLHHFITFKMGGLFNSFVMPPTKLWGVAAADFKAPRLFKFL